MSKSIVNNMIKKDKIKCSQVIWQCAALFILSAILAFSINQFRDSRLPLIGDWSADTRLTSKTGETLIISLAEAEKFFREKKAVFFDARSREDYEARHIAGARNIPWYDVDQYFIKVTEDIVSDTLIITYCDGETCNLSHNLAKFLLDMGFSKVRVLVNGWTIWQENNLPIEKGHAASISE